MNLFLTSNIGGIKKENGKKLAISFTNNNNFLDNLKICLKNYRKFILIASDASNYEQNDLFLKMDIEALNLSGLNFDEYLVLDNRNKDNIENILTNSDLIFLCGGNTFLQNKFFKEINLKEYLNNIDSVIVGISAGAINAADTPYNSPESKEDLNNPILLEGLGLTNINVEPHFELDVTDSNKLIQREVTLKESYNRYIYALTDGAYILETNDFITIYGKCYKIDKGKISLICNDNQKIILKEN